MTHLNYRLALLLVCVSVSTAAAANSDAANVHDSLDNATRVRLVISAPFADPINMNDSAAGKAACTYESSDPAALKELIRDLGNDEMTVNHASQANFPVKSALEFEFSDRAPLKILLGNKNVLTNRARGSFNQQSVIVDGGLPHKISDWVASHELKQLNHAAGNCKDAGAWS